MRLWDLILANREYHKSMGINGGSTNEIKKCNRCIYEGSIDYCMPRNCKDGMMYFERESKK